MIRFFAYFFLSLAINGITKAENTSLQYSEFTQQSIQNNQMIIQRQYAEVAIEQPFFIFNPVLNIWSAYNDRGALIGIGKASGGRYRCPKNNKSCKTPIGHFKLMRKGSRKCYSTTYPVGKGGAPMPYCMFFKRGYAIHASKTVPHFNASHGCIRVTLAAAKWLHSSFMRKNTAIIVLPY